MAAPQNTQPHLRMQLNNYLQAIGGTHRLSWGKPTKNGPDNQPSWSIHAFLDGIEAGYGTGGDLRTAKEEAARQVLKHLLGPEA